MVSFEPRDPQSYKPLSNVSEENARIPQNRAELEEVIIPELTKFCCLVCKAIRSAECNVML